MANVLITGGSGFLGMALTERLLEKGHRIYSVSRHPPEPAENLIPLVGDITKPNLGLEEAPPNISAVHHLAAIHRLGEDTKEQIWETNVLGTKEVLDFCTKYDISHLYFTSTAYTQGRNTYERSKAFCEWMIKRSDIPKITVFKPSIVMGTKQHFYPGHFSQFVGLVIKIHKRSDIVRRKIEGKLRLPVIEPVLRIKANPGGKLNLISIDAVADAMSGIDKPGTYSLTHPDPPTLEQLVAWVSEFIMVRIKIESDFKPNPIEAMFEKMATAFAPYLWGDDFKSDLKDCPPVTKEFIQETIINTLIS